MSAKRRVKAVTLSFCECCLMAISTIELTALEMLRDGRIFLRSEKY